MGKAAHFVAVDQPPFAPASVESPPPAPSPWNPDMAAAPRNGSLILLTESLDREDGIRSVWYVARGTGRPWTKPREGWMGANPREWVPFMPVGWALPGAIG